MFGSPLAAMLLLLTPTFVQDAAAAPEAETAVESVVADAVEAADTVAETVGNSVDQATEPREVVDPDFSGVTVTQVGEVETKPVASEGTSAFVIFLIVAACVIVPFVLGSFLAKKMRLKEYGGKLGLTLFAITLGLAPFVVQLASGEPLRDAIRLGIDLAGGTNMKFAVDQEQLQGKVVGKDVMDQMVGAIKRRIDPAGTQEIQVRTVDADRIEVIIPRAEPEKVEAIKSAITRLGSLEFAILADTRQTLHTGIIDRAQSEPGTEVKNGNGDIVGLWRPVGTRSDGTEVDFVGGPNAISRRALRDGEEIIEYLLVVDPKEDRRITGRLLDRAFEQIDPSSGPVVGFRFNTKGGALFQRLTTRYKPDPGTGFKSRLAVLLDNQIQSAPTINDVIGAQGIIQGDYTQEELQSLINVLNAGALEVPLLPDPVFESTVSPLLGLDVQEKGKVAIAIASIAVFVFMLLYYRAAGLIADICLLVNIVLVLGVMALIDATFTLPGLAGLVLTIGMAVDANVLIFERIREERAKGASLRMAINNGFSKAFTTIVDANVTTLITAVVLYMIGTDTIKGFAVTLFIGIVMSMFTALFVGRMIFEIAEKKRWLSDLRMNSIVGRTDLNFLSYRGIAAIVSLVLIGVGLAALFSRGADNLDIDFRGGSMVTFRLDGENAPSLEEARELIDETFEVEPSVERLELAEADGSEVELFRVRTINRDLDDVRKRVATAFAESDYELPRRDLSLGDVESVPEAAEEADTAPDAFAGGRQRVLTLSSRMTALALQDELDKVMQEVNAEKADQIAIVPLADAAVAEAIEGVAVGDEVADTELTTTFRLRGSADLPAGDFDRLGEDAIVRFAESPSFEEVNTFDTSVAGDTKLLAIVAMLVSLVAIVAYIWIRFQRLTFGLAAVAALVHDVLVVVGMVALGGLLSSTPLRTLLGLEDFKINLPMIAAFLTIVGYSLNDTIVVFDRIREVRGKNPNLSKDMIDASLNQTLARTLLTSITTFLVVLILYVFGGEGIHGFAYCLLLGVLVGTYSSIYVASPVLLWLTNRSDRKAAKEDRELATV